MGRAHGARTRPLPLGHQGCARALRAEGHPPSHGGAVRYVACPGEQTADIARALRAEAVRLNRRGAPAWATSLVVCPNVRTWAADFSTFDAWVSTSCELDDLEEAVSLVAFHPAFERWHALAVDVGLGSKVLAHYEECDGERSKRPLPAVITSVDPQVVGARRVGVQFLDDGVEQWLPLEWLGAPALSAEPLPDNWMHRAPHPTVHLIRRRDLRAVREASGGYGVVADLQLRNSRRAGALGWGRLWALARGGAGRGACAASAGAPGGGAWQTSECGARRSPLAASVPHPRPPPPLGRRRLGGAR